MDPYSVLGVDRNASDEEVKRAYRELVKKYHPDKYAGSDMEHLASEKLKQVNAAYDDIQRMRGKKSGTGGGYQGYQYNSSYSGGSPKYAQVRSNLASGNIAAAESMLDQMTERDAEWHYLKGVVLLRRNWFDGARQHFATAHQMDPSNPEYAQAFNSTNNMGGYRDFYGGNRGNQQNSECGPCDICAGMMCADLCCSMGRCC